MTIEETIKKMLLERGLFSNQCDAIITRMKANPANEVIQERWHDNVEGYSKEFMAWVWYSASKEALAFIDENCPKAWLRPMFAFVEGEAIDERGTK